MKLDSRVMRLLFSFLTTAMVASSLMVLTSTGSAQAQEGAEEECFPAPPNLRAWYTFDNNYNDVMKLQPAGVASGQTSRITNGVVNRAGRFNGGGVTTGPVDLQLGTGPMTIDFWMKAQPNQLSGVRTILDHRMTASTSNDAGFHVFLYNGRLGLQLTGPSGTQNIIPTEAVIRSNMTARWQFVVITIDEEQIMRMYLNGNEIEARSVATYSASRDADGQPLYIGRRLDNSANFRGDLDEVEIFNRALNEDEIGQLLEAPKCAPKFCARQLVTVDMSRGQTPTNGPDVILGTPGDDTINSLGGDDVICALGGHDKVLSGTGNDTVYAGAGNDDINAGPGNDEVQGATGHDVIDAGTGNDVVLGGAQRDIIRGGAGNDSLRGGSGNDSVFGEAGQDKVWGGLNNDMVHGGSGTDLVAGDEHDDVVIGGLGNDQLLGNAGNDLMLGGAGADTMRGGAGNDHLRGYGGADVLLGGTGEDICNGGWQRDRISSDCEVKLWP